MSFLLDLFFPKHSLTGEEGEWITENEWDTLELKPILLEGEELSKRGVKYVDAVAAGGLYVNPLLRKAIQTLKYKRIPELHSLLAAMMIENVDLLALPDNAVIVPVPLHWSRTFHRGFNQAELLSKTLADRTNLQHANLLQRKRSTGRQAHRSHADRLHSMSGAFTVHQKSQIPETVLLIDDVLTTGATMDECAKVLRGVGVEQVFGLVIAC